ncbi:DUF1631 domain-containing protein [Pseudoxanthomonas dokdonensis]|uniref:Thymidine phosphorylase n=1 Tax=Pseudoxanthomonas dokdonensis TaxID=344882 RepID=A0A0R0CUL4_9GAMM|nr:DUF1631 domain-containing protein [Pseudoxanthomonas dokdonensis]KRG70026.1 hypothetical protein ABB29_07235 [Pseudoxanthomonas dokdonensis]
MPAPKSPLAAAPSATIANAPLPPRVRSILRNLLQYASVDLASSLTAMLPEFEQQMFKQADRSHSNNRQAEQLANLRTFQRNHDEFIPHFVFALEAELSGISHAAVVAAESPRVEYRTLTLVEDAVMDQEIVLREVARRSEIRAAGPLLLLGQRFGVLAGQPAFDLTRLPVGPQALCRMLKLAGETLEINLESQLLLYRTFDHKVMHNYAEWAELLNQFLSREGVLPGLVFMPRRVRPASDGSRPQGQAQASARPMTAWQGQAAPANWATLAAADLAAADASAVNSGSPASSNAAPATATPGQAPLPAAADSASADASFATLQKLLSIRRNAQQHDAAQAGAADAGDPGLAANPLQDAAALPDPAPQAANAVAAFRKKLLPTHDVLETLKTLQSADLPERPHNGRRRSMQDLQQAMLAQARQQHGPQAALASADSDTFELLDLLYNEIDREVQQDAAAADLLVALQVPVVQAALRDRNFFLRPQHPARELLNAVAESGATWLGDDDVDPQLVQKLQEAVQNVVADYDGDDIVFERANQDLQQHLQAMARKAELAERRQIEAARGKERLEIAKQKASDTIHTALRDQQPQKFVQALLNQAWADVLTLALLRNGEDSDEWHEQLQTTLEIVAATSAGEASDGNPELAGKIEQSLLQVGYHGDEAAAIARRLSSSEDDETTSRTELTARLKARSRLGDQSSTPTPRKKPHERTPEEQQAYDHLRSLPFGTWFEFTHNQQGDVRRQRLSWFSPVTGNALFVNQRGQRVGEHSMDTIAHLMAKGQVRIVSEDRGRLIDRAWNATLKALRGLTSRGPDASGEPA